MSQRWVTAIASSVDVIMIVLASAVGLDAWADERLTKRPWGGDSEAIPPNDLLRGFGRTEAAAEV